MIILMALTSLQHPLCRMRTTPLDILTNGDNIVFTCQAIKDPGGAIKLRMCDYGLGVKEFLNYRHQKDYPYIMRSFADGDIYFKKNFSLKGEFYNLAIAMDEKRSCDVSKEKLDFYKELALKFAEKLFEEDI